MTASNPHIQYALLHECNFKLLLFPNISIPQIFKWWISDSYIMTMSCISLMQNAHIIKFSLCFIGRTSFLVHTIYIYIFFSSLNYYQHSWCVQFQSFQSFLDLNNGVIWCKLNQHWQLEICFIIIFNMHCITQIL